MAASITVRKPNFTFDFNIPKHWFADSSFGTHFFNALNIIFPTGEKFFIKAIKIQLDEIRDPVLLQDCKAFLGQEAQHFAQHEKFLEILGQQGYKFDQDLKNIAVLMDFFLKNAPAKLNLAMVAGFEHFTAVFAHLGLESKVLELAEEPLKSLFEWHAAEEIEHKAVAFDVLTAIDNNYFLRVSGMILASFILWGLMSKLTIQLVWQDKKLFDLETLQSSFRILFGKYNLLPKSVFAFFEYFQPGFHPNQTQDKYLAEEVFSKNLSRSPEVV